MAMSVLVPSLLFGAIAFALGFAAGQTKAERRNRLYWRIWSM
jgi:hypothetical protein